MFVGREAELARLNRAANKGTFQMAVVYGRRRVGKTALLSEFCRNRKTLFFTALEQSDSDNLNDFSTAASEFFEEPLTFENWKDALTFLAIRASTDPFVFVFDEFPYAAKRHPALPSELQVLIDHKLQNTSMFLILCGSNQGFMESEVLGRHSPLYGRRTLQIRLRPLGYRDAARMLPGLAPQEAFRAYGCFGGVPYYLKQVDENLSLRENLLEQFFDPTGFLYGEPQMLLRQELSEPAMYNSILRAIGAGVTRLGDIASRVGMEPTNMPRYLSTLSDLDIIERVFPFGENTKTSRKSIYRIREAPFDFWYRFVMPRISQIEDGLGMTAAARMTDEVLNTHLGFWFERICAEWVRDQTLEGTLPLDVTEIGRWWGPNPILRESTDIDVVASDDHKHLLIGECKYRSSFDETEAIEGLMAKRRLIKDHEATWFILISRYPVHEATARKYADRDNVALVTLDDLYGDWNWPRQ